MAQMRREAMSLAAAYVSVQPGPLPLPPGAALETISADQALALLPALPPAVLSSQVALAAATRLQAAAASLQAFEQYLHASVLAACAAAAVRAGPLPAKLNGLIQVCG